MAVAKKVPIEQYKIVLELNQKEAEVIRCLVGSVCNSEGSHIREITDSIWKSLVRLQIDSKYDVDGGYIELIETKERN